jgi:hypothetical protein
MGVSRLEHHIIRGISGQGGQAELSLSSKELVRAEKSEISPPSCVCEVTFGEVATLRF